MKSFKLQSAIKDIPNALLIVTSINEHIFVCVINNKLYRYIPNQKTNNLMLLDDSFDKDLECCTEYLNTIFKTGIQNTLKCCIRKNNIYLISYSNEDVYLNIWNDYHKDFIDICHVDNKKIKETVDYKIVNEMIKRFL